KNKKKTTKKIKKILIFLLILAITTITIGYVRVKNHVKEVHKWDTEVTKKINEYHIEKYEALVYAIIYTESKGQDTDIM
ncbi:lysozyme family protein, partial [Clostridium tepidum]